MSVQGSPAAAEAGAVPGVYRADQLGPRPTVDAAAMADRMPSVRVALDRQVDVVTDTGRSVEEVHNIIGMLEDRLAAVLLPPQPEPGVDPRLMGGPLAPPTTCALAEEIISRTAIVRDANERLGQAGLRLMALIGRVDV